MSRLLELSDEEYLEIEEVLASNARGRAFLRMRDKRSQTLSATDLQRLLRELRDERAKEETGSGRRDEPHVRILREELREMSAYMNQTRREIAALRPADAGSNRIMAATGELDAIVSATERATSDILNAAEHIQALADKLPQEGEVGAVAQEIAMQITEVLTACSFQDITGQRTTKVVNTLRYIEQRVNSMIEIWGTDGSILPAVVPSTDTRPDAHLMNGPAIDGGPSQDDVDALLAKLDQNIAPSNPAPIALPQRRPEPAAAPAAAAPTAAPARRPAPAAPPPGATSSQSDIDALFN